MNLFNLFAKLTLDNSEYEAKMKDSQKTASSFSSKIGTAFKVGAKAVTAFATTVVAATTAIAALAVKTVNFGSEIDDNAQKLGVSTEAYQYWSLVLQRAGTDASQLSMAIRQMTEFTTQLSEGNGDALLSLQKLGIGYEEFMAMNTEQQLYAIVEALQGVESQTDKVQLAQEIFGNRVYQELLPLLGMQQGSLEDLKDEFEGLGLIIADDTIKQTAALGDKFDNLVNSFKVGAFAIATDLLPEIELITDGLMGLASGSDDAMQSLSNGLVGLIDKVAQSMPTIIDTAGNLLINLIDGLADIIPQTYPKIVEVLETLLFKMVEILPTLTQAWLEIAVALIDGLINLDWGSLLINLLNVIIEVIAVQLPNMLIDVFLSIFDLVFGFFSADGLNSFLQFGRNLSEALINGLISGIETGVNGVIKVINGVLGTISKAWTWAGIPAIPTIPGITIPRVDFAEGGMFDEAQRGTLYALAGEDGAEIVAQGSRGTGVANIEQISEAQYEALDKYRLKEIINNAAAEIVNGIMAALTLSNKGIATPNITVRIGEKEFKSYIVQATNDTLRAQGRKSLNTVTAY